MARAQAARSGDAARRPLHSVSARSQCRRAYSAWASSCVGAWKGSGSRDGGPYARHVGTRLPASDAAVRGRAVGDTVMPRTPLKLAAALIMTLAILGARGPALGVAADSSAASVAAAPAMQGSQPATVQTNVMNAHVWAGMYGNYFNGPFTAVTICQSGTTACETISGILIDTGSFGLRIFGQANHLTLATETASDGDKIVECVPFGTLPTWGRVAYADVKLGGEPVISKLPIQIINQNYSSIPAVCKSGGPPVAQSPTQVGYNGILGVGLWGADCGGACASLGPWNPSMYFQCSGGGCTVAPVADARQV